MPQPGMERPRLDSGAVRAEITIKLCKDLSSCLRWRWNRRTIRLFYPPDERNKSAALTQALRLWVKLTPQHLPQARHLRGSMAHWRGGIRAAFLPLMFLQARKTALIELWRHNEAGGCGERAQKASSEDRRRTLWMIKRARECALCALFSGLFLSGVFALVADAVKQFNVSHGRFIA